MNITLTNKICLTPRLLGLSGDGAARADGILEINPANTDESTRQIVYDFSYDGYNCAYLVRSQDAGTLEWLPHHSSMTYTSYAFIVMSELAERPGSWDKGLHRVPGSMPSKALSRQLRRLGTACVVTVLDSCVLENQAVWVLVAATQDTEFGGNKRKRLIDSQVVGWIPLVAGSVNNAVSNNAGQVRYVRANAYSGQCRNDQQQVVGAR